MDNRQNNSHTVKRSPEFLFWGVILLVIGALFMLDNFGIDIDVWETLGKFWPMILIFIGLKNIWVYYRNKQEQQENNRQP